VTGLLLARDPHGAVPFLDSQDLWLSAVAGLAFLGRPALRRYTARFGMSCQPTVWCATGCGSG
jgi:hypothetical protein